MPESKSEQVRHSNEEISNFLLCGDARGPGWLQNHPGDREKAMRSLQAETARRTSGAVVEPGLIRS